MSLSCKLQEAHYCALQSQTNVYGLAKVSMPCGQQKLLVASLRGKVISMEFQKTRPLSKEVHFTYIPGDAEILSIDAFNKTHSVVVGITFMKTSKNERFLNIYSEVEPESEFNLDSIAQGCNSLILDFLPYQLYHTEVMCGGVIETVFLLGGSDGKIHMYKQDKMLHQFNEEPTEDMFPEFTDMENPITCMDCRTYDDYQRRVSAVGCQNGLLQVYHVDATLQTVLSSWKIELDSPLLSLSIFTLSTSVPCPSFVKQVVESDEESSEGRDFPDLHLVVASAIEPSIVYRSIIERGLSEPLVLPDSAQYDAVLCVKVADVDFDGENEILIGTYGQEMLVYKFYSHAKSKAVNMHSETTSNMTPGQAEGSAAPTQSDTPTCGSPNSSFSNTPEHSVDSIEKRKGTIEDGEFRFLWQRSFPDPVMGLDVLDITGDGLQEIVVTSLQGLHILQHDLESAAELCIRRLRELTQHQPGEDVFQQLLAENLSS